MIQLLRIDYRLIHGQTAFAWTNYLSADAILVANDDVASDLFRKRTMNMSKPSNTKMIFKSLKDSIDAINSGVTDKYKLFIIVENVEDAYFIASNVEQNITINVGLVSKRDETKNIAKSVYLTDEEIEKLVELEKKGNKVEVKQSPTDTALILQNLI